MDRPFLLSLPVADGNDAGGAGRGGYYGYRTQISEIDGASNATPPGTRVIKEYRLTSLKELTPFDVLGRSAYKFEFYGPLIV